MRRRVSAEIVGSLFVVRGWYAHKLAVEAVLRPTFSGVHNGWMADLSRLPTFEAYCAHRNVPLDVEGVPRAQVEQAGTGLDNLELDAPLFDLGER